jgi:pimeloyl-ACP methyl ester carboxylesterase
MALKAFARRVAAALALLLVPKAYARGQAADSGSSGGYIAVAGSRLYYEECGGAAARRASRPSVVLVHDGVMGAATWDAVWPDLCARFHVVRYDRRGKGRSPAPTAPFSQVADLAALLADRGVARATVVGSSAGGALALDFALAHPDRVERLILLGPVLGGMSTSAHFQARERVNFAPLVERGDVEAAAVLQAEDRYALAPGSAEARRRVLAYLRQNPQNLRGALTDGRFQERPAVPAAARLGDLRVPTLILVGESDIPDVHAHAGAIEHGVGSARREVVPGAGHLPQLEQPALLANRITAFIAATPIAAAAPQRLAPLAGEYAPFVRGQPGRVAVRDGRLVAQLPGERDVPLFAADDSTFYTPFGPGLRVTFHRGPDGWAASADVTVGGATHRAVAAPRAR